MTRPTAGQLLAMLRAATETLSQSRGQMLLDQAWGLFVEGGHGVAFAVSRDGHPGGPGGDWPGGDWPGGNQADGTSPLAFAVLSVPPETDAATLLFAGPAGPPAAESPDRPGLPAEAVAGRLAEGIEAFLIGRGVRFLQWATDPVDADPVDAAPIDTPALSPSVPFQASPFSAAPSGPARLPSAPLWWARHLGMRRLATLEYLTLDLDETVAAAPELQPDPACVSGPACVSDPAVAGDSVGANVTMDGLELCPIDWGRPESAERFTRIVEQTYRGTLDCPGLSDFRSAEQTIRGYRQAASFDPAGWFLVRGVAHEGTAADIGVLILATHPATVGDGGPKSDSPVALRGGVSELVYMGLVPAARRRGHSQSLIRAAIRRAAARGAAKMILAVDETNTPARRAYCRIGFEKLMAETVFARSLPAAP